MNTGTFQVYLYCWKRWYLRSLEHVSDTSRSSQNLNAKYSGIVKYPYTSIWDLKYNFPNKNVELSRRYFDNLNFAIYSISNSSEKSRRSRVTSIYVNFNGVTRFFLVKITPKYGWSQIDHSLNVQTTIPNCTLESTLKKHSLRNCVRQRCTQEPWIMLIILLSDQQETNIM